MVGAPGQGAWVGRAWVTGETLGGSGVWVAQGFGGPGCGLGPGSGAPRRSGGLGEGSGEGQESVRILWL